jgi:preprotein translocase subunit SecF
MGKFSDFLKKDFKIVENRKYLFLVPIVIVLIAMIFMVCFINAEKDANAAFNLGMDFTGGYKVTVKLGEKIQNDNYNELVGQLNDSFDNVELEGGAKVKVRKIKITTQSSGSDKAFVISFQKPANVSEEQMEEYNEALAQEIEKTRMEIAQSYGELNVELNQFIIPSEKMMEASKELNDLFNLEQDVNIYMINIDSLSDDYDMTTAQMEAIMFMIE